MQIFQCNSAFQFQIPMCVPVNLTFLCALFASLRAKDTELPKLLSPVSAAFSNERNSFHNCFIPLSSTLLLRRKLAVILQLQFMLQLGKPDGCICMLCVCVCTCVCVCV